MFIFSAWVFYYYISTYYFHSNQNGRGGYPSRYVKQFGEERLPKYIAHLEAVLRHNQGSEFVLGPRLTVADLVVWHFLCALDVHYHEYYAREMAGAPLLTAFKARIAERPRIKAYLQSDRCQPFDTDSCM